MWWYFWWYLGCEKETAPLQKKESAIFSSPVPPPHSGAKATCRSNLDPIKAFRAIVPLRDGRRIVAKTNRVCARAHPKCVTTCTREQDGRIHEAERRLARADAPQRREPAGDGPEQSRRRSPMPRMSTRSASADEAHRAAGSDPVRRRSFATSRNWPLCRSPTRLPSTSDARLARDENAGRVFVGPQPTTWTI